ncbi:uncharacterized protein BcabD6B2_56150 [Babesia caballi]|uniref:Uncharacterized protein n=1 Tax=Babesia caballi TaxID=5871 RepID=A0AAV4M5S5_BABCB|nr:hypothetical protein BcabD6B2_56150 [Babesia caballi]
MGPFVYGFTFGNRWRRGGSIYEIVPQLLKDIAKLTGSCTSANDGTLAAFWKCINPTPISCPLPLSSVVKTTVIQATHHEEVPNTATVPGEKTGVETPGRPQQENQQSPPATGEQPHVPEPAPATESPSISSSSSSVDAAASAAVPALSKDQTITVDETAGHSSRSQASGPSGANSTATCSTRESCPDHTQYGSSEGATGSAQSTHNANADVNNTQSTITIGGAAGGAAVLGGGCAALYFLNVGGIKTLITGVP